MILYEYPFNERIRTYLRLEQLFRRLALLMSREHPVDHHHALATLFEILDVAARADLKSDVMKDLERQKSVLAGYRGNPAIAEAVLTLGQKLGVEVVAEGIETPAAMTLLRDRGCGLGQGYLIGAPMRAQQLREWQRAREAMLSAAVPA